MTGARATQQKETVAMSNVHLYSAEVCPYAARTRLLLIEKGVPFELTEIDLKAKPAWFAEISPYGKVPVLKCGADLVWESSIINEYVDEVFPDPPMMPREPGARARARFWIDFANVKFMPTWYRLFLAQCKAERAALADELAAHFVFMETAGIGASGGPFWMGASIGLVDFTYQPWFERIPAMEHYRGVGLPRSCARLKTWSAAMAERASVRAITRSVEQYIEGYRRYADGTEDGATARDMRRAAG